MRARPTSRPRSTGAAACRCRAGSTTRITPSATGSRSRGMSFSAGQAGRLPCTSFEASPLAPGDILRATSAFREAPPLAGPLAAYLGGDRDALPDLALTLVTGGARLTLPDWAGRADAWFLDGFSPAKNPELWESGLLAEVARHTAPGGSFATYTAAGAVRRSLAEAGFTVDRAGGFGAKRHMSRGVLA